MRLEFSSNKKYVFVGGIGSKIIKRNLRDFNDKKFSKGCKAPEKYLTAKSMMHMDWLWITRIGPGFTRRPLTN